jgi:hypothetical protein
MTPNVPLVETVPLPFISSEPPPAVEATPLPPVVAPLIPETSRKHCRSALPEASLSQLTIPLSKYEPGVSPVTPGMWTNPPPVGTVSPQQPPPSLPSLGPVGPVGPGGRESQRSTRSRRSGAAGQAVDGRVSKPDKPDETHPRSHGKRVCTPESPRAPEPPGARMHSCRPTPPHRFPSSVRGVQGRGPPCPTTPRPLTRHARNAVRSRSWITQRPTPGINSREKIRYRD